LVSGRLCCLFALALLPSIPVAQSSWEQENRAGEKAFQEGRLADANRFFTEALRQAQRLGPNDVRLSPIYNNLALVAFVQNNFIASETLYQKALAIMESQGSDNPLLLPILDNLSGLYVKQWAFGNAIRASWRACHIREIKFGPANPETAVGLNNVATLYLNNVRLLPQSPSDNVTPHDAPKAGSSDQRSSCELRDFGASIESAWPLDDATKLAISESLFERVLEIQEKAYGSENTRLVDVLESLGDVRQAEGKTVAEEKAYMRALAIVEKNFGPDDLRLAIPLQRLAELNLDDQKYAEAEKFYQRALRIEESKAGTTDSSLVATLTGYAAVLEKMQRSQEAKSLTERASTLSEPRMQKGAALLPTVSVPYVLRFEKSIYDKHTGFQQTCMLVSEDGRFRIEERQQEQTGPVIVQDFPHPDNVGIGSQESLADPSSTGLHAPKILDGSLDAGALQQLKAILSTKEVRDLHGSYKPPKETNVSNIEQIAVSVLREDEVQNFAFADASALKPYQATLKPLLKWLDMTEKHRGSVTKSAAANNCSPDAPKAVAGRSAIARRPATSVVPDSIATLKVDVNLVPVHVVVRDSQGKAVGNLRKDDFQILDNGKPQLITQFSAEHIGSLTTLPLSESEKAAEQTSTMAQYTAYLFDDLDLERADLVRAWEGVDRQLALLSPERERAAIFTTSGQRGIDFTADRSQLHETLIHLESRKKQKVSDCPALSYHMADLIANSNDQDALHVAAEDALECTFDTKNLDAIENAKFRKTAIQIAQSAAREKVETVRIDTVSLLRILKELVEAMSKAPGHRTLVVVSSGFFLSSDQSQADIVDLAMHGNVIINALDPRGLVTATSIRDQSASKFNPANPESTAYQDPSESEQQALLGELANATGGTFFHNSNDVDEGFRRLAALPEYSYALAFSPQGMSADGRFHTLRVTINGGDILTVQARRGYYAPGKKQ